MRRAACGRCRVIELSRFCLGKRNQLLQGVRRNRGIHHHDGLGACNRRNRREVVDDRVRRRHEKRVDDERVGSGKEDRMTIGPGLGDDVGTDHRVPARAVVHNHLLAQAFCQFLSDKTSQRVVAASRTIGADEANRLARVVLLGGGKAGDHRQHDYGPYSSNGRDGYHWGVKFNWRSISAAVGSCLPHDHRDRARGKALCQ